MARRQDEQGEQITAIVETTHQLLLPELSHQSAAFGFNAERGSQNARTPTLQWTARDT
jgi:hypothetical protein